MKPTPVNNVTYIPRVIRPQCDAGIDWSRERVVLVRRGTLELWWMKSGKCWAGIGMPADYVPTELRLMDLKKRGEIFGVELHEGGRLSRALLEKYTSKIDDFFGCMGVVELVDLRGKRTLVLE